jgi:hypothetical protein
MPESYGKRQRNAQKAKKIAVREERRLARNQRRADRAAGVIEAHAPIQTDEEMEEARRRDSNRAPEEQPDPRDSA